MAMRTTSAVATLWDELLPVECRTMPAELTAIDALLDDPRFFAPYRPFFHPVLGRPSVPVETYLRLMWLKFRYQLGYETLCREVNDSLSWRRFCRIALGAKVPDPSTLMKTTRRCGPEVIDALNDTLLAKAAEAKVLRLDKVRADGTVVPANVRYPTDSGLLARGVARLGALTRRIKNLGLAPRTPFRDRGRSMRRRAHDIGAWLRRRTDTAKAEVAQINAQMATLAEASVAEARAVAANARRSLRRMGDRASGNARAAVVELEQIAALVETIAAQTRTRLAGQTPEGATRVVSLHDTDARPIVKGKLGVRVQYGYLGFVVDNRDGIVVDHQVHRGNPPEGPMLVPAIKRLVARFGKAPKAVTADRAYGEAGIEAELVDPTVGVGFVAIPRKGRLSASRQSVQRQRRFVRLIKWRTGSEGRIAHLKYSFGWDRTLLVGIDGARTWCGLGVLAHNTVKITRLIDERDQRRAARRPPGASPPRAGPASPTPSAA